MFQSPLPVRRPFQAKGVCEPNGSLLTIAERAVLFLGVFMRDMIRTYIAVLVLAGNTDEFGRLRTRRRTGAISGVVVDTSGGSVGDAEVQIIDTRTESLARQSCHERGWSFVAPLLLSGIYIVW